MSFFSYNNSTAVLRDSTVVQYFRLNAPNEYLTRLNLDLGTALTAQEFLLIQDYFKNTALRDPTVGELRLLDAAAQRSHCTADRIAVGELITQSPALAETWADMMAKHSALNGSSAVTRSPKNHMPLCSLGDALSLSGRYLYRMELRAPEDTVLLSAPYQEAMAAAEGYRPVARIKVGRSIRSLWERRARLLEETPCRSGDVLLYLPRLTLRQAQELVASEADKRRPALGAIRAVTEKSLLATILELCPAASIHAARLPGAGQNGADIPFPFLCDRPSVAGDGVCGYLVRIPQKQMTDMTMTLQSKNLPFIPCGHARTDGNLVITLPDMSGLGEYAAVSLPAELIHAVSIPRACSMTPEATEGAAPRAVCPPISRLPSTDREASGLTPDGHETVALTLLDRELLYIPEAQTAMTVRTVEIPVTGSAYSAAAEATATAALALEREGLAPASIRLSVSLTVAGSALLTDGPALAAICGVYCAAAQLAAPVEDPVVEIAPASVPLSLTVTAWGRAPQAPASEDDRQWSATVDSDGKNALGYTLPVLRRVCEGSLRALSAALCREKGATCVLRPLAVHSVTDPETGESRYRLHPDSLHKLLEELSSSLIPVIALSRSDTLLLFGHPEVADAFLRRAENGYPTLVLGESCSVFADHGLLPEVLTETHSLPFGSQAAAATYAFSDEPATRLLRADPMTAADTAAAMNTPHLLELTLPDGAVIPDGFSLEGSRTLGLLNGLDTATLTRLCQLGFSVS